MWNSRSPNRLPARQWRKLRAAILGAEPWCRMCVKAERLTINCIATEVDHIVSLAAGGTNDRSNLQPLCSPCHALKTAQEAAEAQGKTGPAAIRRPSEPKKPKPNYGPDGWPT